MVTSTKQGHEHNIMKRLTVKSVTQEFIQFDYDLETVETKFVKRLGRYFVKFNDYQGDEHYQYFGDLKHAMAWLEETGKRIYNDNLQTEKELMSKKLETKTEDRIKKLVQQNNAARKATLNLTREDNMVYVDALGSFKKAVPLFTKRAKTKPQGFAKVA